MALILRFIERFPPVARYFASTLAIAVCAAFPAAAGANAVTSVAASAECERPGTLGVSRVVEIDTSDGPHFGQLQYGKNLPSFLKDREVVLTFDDGPMKRKTERVLEALAAECTLATFFAVGRMAVVHPEILREVADAGHTVAHHTWSHKNQNQRSLARSIAEFELGLSAVTAAIGRPSAPFFRFPYLADPNQMRAYLAQRQFGVFSIDIDSYDFRTRSPSTMLRNTMAQLRKRGRGIILFHDIQTSTANGIHQVLDELKSGGYKVVHIIAKAPARTLPEYDEEALVLLDKRHYRAAARPIKTSFQFNGKPVPVEPVGNNDDGERLIGSTRPSASSPSAAGSSSTFVAPAAEQPDWKRKVFGFSRD